MSIKKCLGISNPGAPVGKLGDLMREEACRCEWCEGDPDHPEDAGIDDFDRPRLWRQRMRRGMLNQHSQAVGAHTRRRRSPGRVKPHYLAQSSRMVRN
jgi:hypothetical protein